MKSSTTSPFIFVRQHPMLRVLIPFVTGVAIQHQVNFLFDYILYFLDFFFLLLIFSFGVKSAARYSTRPVKGWLMCFVLIGLGALTLNLKTSIFHPDHFIYRSASQYMVCIDDIPVEKEKSIKCIAKVLTCIQDRKAVAADGKIILYIQKDSAALLLKYGDALIVNCRPAIIEPPANEGDFDYRKYLAFHQIYYQSYLQHQNWICIGKDRGSPIFCKSYAFRNKLLGILEAHMKDSQEFAVAAALTIGDVSSIDPDLMQAFSSSGTLHVLSVSGMHVGVIYLLLTTIFGFAEKSKLLRHLYFPTIIILIWSYGFLTGSSPSVLRAAAMLSLIVFGKWLKTKSPVLNTLFASMVLLLCYDPYFLFDVGFQLSYLAVIGIVVLHPMIVKLMILENKWLHKIWELISVSLAAQLITVPITFYYFHQFPNYFILANLIVIPLTTIAIYLSIFVLVFSGVSYVGDLVTQLDVQLIRLVNAIVHYIDQLPGAVTSGISITIFEVVVMFAMLITVVVWVRQKTFVSLMLFLSCMILFSTSQLQESISQRSQNTIVYYHLKKQVAYGWIKGRRHLLLADSAVIADVQYQQRHFGNLWIAKGLSRPFFIIQAKE